MEKAPFNKLPGADLHGSAGTKAPADRETRYREGKPSGSSDKED